jgi:hypothetical protein
MHSLADLGSLQDQLVTTRDQRAALSEIKLQLHAQRQLVRFLSAREHRATTLAAAKAVRRALVRATTTTEGLRRRLVGLSQEVGTATIDLTLTTGVPLPPQATDEAQPSPLDTLWALLRSAF